MKVEPDEIDLAMMADADESDDYIPLDNLVRQLGLNPDDFKIRSQV